MSSYYGSIDDSCIRALIAATLSVSRCLIGPMRKGGEATEEGWNERARRGHDVSDRLIALTNYLSLYGYLNVTSFSFFLDSTLLASK